MMVFRSYKFYNIIGILLISFYFFDFVSDNSFLIFVDVGVFFFVVNWFLLFVRELDFCWNIKFLIFVRIFFLDEFFVDICLYLGMLNFDF